MTDRLTEIENGSQQGAVSSNDIAWLVAECRALVRRAASAEEQNWGYLKVVEEMRLERAVLEAEVRELRRRTRQ